MADAYGSIASNPTEITLGATVTDNIATSSDVDYFKLPQASSLSKLTLDFTGLSSTTNDNEFKISVRNASDSVVATTTKGLSTTLNASIAADANYYIRVEKGTTTSTANYSIKAALTPTVETECRSPFSTQDVSPVSTRGAYSLQQQKRRLLQQTTHLLSKRERVFC